MLPAHTLRHDDLVGRYPRTLRETADDPFDWIEPPGASDAELTPLPARPRGLDRQARSPLVVVAFALTVLAVLLGAASVVGLQ